MPKETLFLASFRYKVADEDKTTKVLFKAVNYTDAETLATQYAEDNFGSENEIVSIVRKKYADFLIKEETLDCRSFFDVKLAFITFDESTGKEKRSAFKMLVESNDIKECLTRIENVMNMNDYEILSLALTQISDFILNK